MSWRKPYMNWKQSPRIWIAGKSHWSIPIKLALRYILGIEFNLQNPDESSQPCQRKFKEMVSIGRSPVWTCWSNSFSQLCCGTKGPWRDKRDGKSSLQKKVRQCSISCTRTDFCYIGMPWSQEATLGYSNPRKCWQISNQQGHSANLIIVKTRLLYT